jgi:hypothetical protein
MYSGEGTQVVIFFTQLSIIKENSVSAFQFWTSCLLFIKSGINFMPLESTPLAYFLIFDDQQ